MNTYLVTGGAGFIGSNLVDELIKENKIIVIDNFNDYYSSEIKENNIKENLNNPNYKLERIDIRDMSELDRVFKNNSIDVVIHLAGIGGVRNSIINPREYQEVNYIGTLNILDAMKKHNITNIIMASSSSVYGNNTDEPFKETYECNMPISPYAASKKSAKILLKNSYLYLHKTFIIYAKTLFVFYKSLLTIHIFYTNMIVVAILCFYVVISLD